MDADNLLKYADMLFKTAISKTHNVDEAEELVQETYLQALIAISKNTNIEHPKSYLTSILNNRFYLYLKEKYNITTISYDSLPVDISDNKDHFSEISTDEGALIRRELAFMAYIYREVMVRYYMQNQSVKEIAQALDIPKGTVLSRLDSGRKKIKKGVSNMENYTNNSYKPEILTIGINGRIGRNNEPFSCIKNSLDQNILILAYEKSVTIDELSKSLGVSMAFVEESVNALVYNQLMKREKRKVYTDFIITSLEDSFKALEVSKKFAKDTFDTANHVFIKMAEKYKNIKGFSVFDNTQLYIMAVLSSKQNYMSRISEAVAGKLTKFDEYPDRPNYGKWIICGSKYPNGYNFNDERTMYSISGRCQTSDINEHIRSSCEWDTPIGHTHLAHFKYNIEQNELALAIDSVRTETVNAFQAELIPDLERQGFIKTVNGKKIPAVPYITHDEEMEFFNIEKSGANEFCKLLLDKAVSTVKKATIKYPKHISFVPDFIYSDLLFYLPMAFIYEANSKGIIKIEKDKCYPTMYIVTK